MNEAMNTHQQNLSKPKNVVICDRRALVGFIEEQSNTAYNEQHTQVLSHRVLLPQYCHTKNHHCNSTTTWWITLSPEYQTEFLIFGWVNLSLGTISGLYPWECNIWMVKECVRFYQEITKLWGTRHMCKQNIVCNMPHMLTLCVLDQFRKLSASLWSVKYHIHNLTVLVYDLLLMQLLCAFYCFYM